MAEETAVSQTTQNQFSQTQRAYTENCQPALNQFTTHAAYYAIYPSYYMTFANWWLRRWLEWFDGYVPGIHGGASGILSTRLATTLCYRLAEQVFGGGLLFTNDKKSADAKRALEFISGHWSEEAGLDEQVLKAFVLTAAGGTAYIKTNMNADHELWIDTWRADECWSDIDFKGEVIRAKFLTARFTKTVPAKNEQPRNFYLVEDRFIATARDAKEYKREFEKKIENFQVAPALEVGAPYARYCVYELTGTVNNFDNIGIGRPYNWEELPDDIKRSMQEQYGTIRLNVPQRLPFTDIGVDMCKWTSFISNLPQLPYGESVVEKIQTYLFEYDFMNSCMNTDFYLARGRVLVPKSLQSPKPVNLSGVSSTGNYNQGLDSFLFTKVDYASTEDKKPEAIQFDLRANEWLTARNHLIECISTAIGISPSTLASYLNDSSARTAREISSEESATALYVENRRKLLVKPLNSLIKRVLLFYGYADSVSVKFSKSGQTNTTLLIENTVNAYNAGLKSEYQAVKDLNPDMTEEELQAEIARIHQDKERASEENGNLFGGQDERFDEASGAFADTEQREQMSGENSTEREPNMASVGDRASANAN